MKRAKDQVLRVGEMTALNADLGRTPHANGQVVLLAGWSPSGLQCWRVAGLDQAWDWGTIGGVMSRRRKSTNGTGGHEGSGPFPDSDAWMKSFPPTMWTRIEEARKGDEAAKSEFYRRYRTPVFCYYRSLLRRYSMDDAATAEDLTHDFFTKLVTGELLAKLQPRKYRFRSFLKVVLRHLFVDWLRGGGAQKRWPRGGIASLDRVRGEVPCMEPADEKTPEDVLDEEYTYALLNTVIERVKCECNRDDLATHFAVFAAKRLQDKRRLWREIGAQYGLPEDQARNMAKIVEKRLQKALREEVRTPGMSDPDVDEEIRDLMRVFRRGGRWRV